MNRPFFGFDLTMAWALLVVLALLTLQLARLMAPHLHALRRAGGGLSALTFARQPDTAEALLRRWGPETIRAHLRPHLRQDFAFLLAYTASLTLACLLVAHHARGGWIVTGWGLAAAALLAGFLDAVENALLLRQSGRFLRGAPLARWVARSIWWSATLKWALVTGAMLYAAVGLLLVLLGGWFVLPVLLLLGAGLVVLLQWRTYTLQYLFVCRFPLLLALALAIGMPFLLLGSGVSQLFGNLAVVEGTNAAGDWRAFQVFMVAFLAALTAWTVRFTLMRTLEVAPFRLRLPLRKPVQPDAKPILHASRTGRLMQRVRRHVALALTRWSPAVVRAGRALYLALDAPRVLPAVRERNPKRFRELMRDDYYLRSLLIHLLLAIPVVAVVAWQSRFVLPDGSGQARATWLWPNVGWAILGFVVSILMMTLFDSLHFIVAPRRAAPAAEGEERLRLFGKLSRWLLNALAGHEEVDRQAPYAKQLWDGGRNGCPGNSPLLRLKHAQALFFTLLFFASLVLVGWLTRPQRDVSIMPPLALVFLLLVLFALILTFLSAWLDRLRVPVLTAAIVLYAACYMLFGHDYTFDVLAAEAAAPDPATALHETYQRWAAQGSGTLTAVAATGGGITAARWTAEVLTRLQRRYPRFDSTLFLISSVSGGSIGSLFYLDRYACDATGQDAARLDTVRLHAGRASLYAVTHGLLTRDVFRVVPPFSLLRGDRGRDLEETWRARMCDGDAGLKGWTSGPWRPLPFFNATVVETGERAVFAPPGLWPRADSVAHGLTRRIDLRLATAARLSATFPYVSPIAQPPTCARGGACVPDSLGYHFADGGYYDNDGITTALETLEAVLRDTVRVPARVLLVIISLQPERPPGAQQGKGWQFATFGPVSTMLAVRNRSQGDRNNLAVEQFRRHWQEERGVPVEVVRFFLPDTMTVPLSWQLSRAEEAAIGHAWRDQHDSLGVQVRRALYGR